MHKERTKTEEYIPIVVCPDCLQAGLQTDPRTKVPAYPVIESTCFTHRGLRGEFKGILGQPTNPAESDKI